MSAKLFCKFGDRKGDSFVIDQEAQIGRSKSSEIQITHPVISGAHARIYYDDKKGHYMIEDLGSRNGTWLDGTKIVGTERLDRLHTVRFSGSLVYFFQDLTHYGLEPMTGDVLVDREELPKPAKNKATTDDGMSAPQFDIRALGSRKKKSTQQGLPVMQVPEMFAGKKEAISYVLAVTNLQKRLEFPLVEGENAVGRAMDVQIRIDDSEISRRHAVLTLRDGVVKARDLGSTNKTFVDEAEVTTQVVCPPKSQIRFGKVEATLTAKKG